MKSEEKIEYMLNKVRKIARINPAGYFFVDCVPHIDIEANGGVPDEAPILFSTADQIMVLKKFDQDGLLFGLKLDKKRKGAWTVLMNLDKDSDENPYKIKSEKHKDKQMLEVSVLSGKLEINENTGFVKLNKIGNTLNIKGGEFKVILTLVKNKDHQATYTQLIEGGDIKTKRRPLGFTVRNLKRALGILPKKRSKNKDIIQNIRSVGYKLLTSHKKTTLKP